MCQRHAYAQLRRRAVTFSDEVAPDENLEGLQPEGGEWYRVAVFLGPRCPARDLAAFLEMVRYTWRAVPDSLGHLGIRRAVRASRRLLPVRGCGTSRGSWFEAPRNARANSVRGGLSWCGC